MKIRKFSPIEKVHFTLLKQDTFEIEEDEEAKPGENMRKFVDV